MRWGVALSLALFAVLVTQCDGINFKTRTATRIAYTNITQVPFWVPFDASNFSTTLFRTGMLEPQATTMMIDLFDFKFNIPMESTIRGIVFTMEQCSSDVAFPWSVEGHLIRGSTVLGSTTHRLPMNPSEVGQTCFAEQRHVILGGLLELWGIPNALPKDFEPGAFGIALQIKTFRAVASRDGTNTSATTTGVTTANATTSAPTTAASTTAAPTTAAPTTAAPTTATPTTAAPTTAAPHPGAIAFRKPQLTIYYEAMCALYEHASCSDDGESVITKPVELHTSLTLPTDGGLVLELDDYREAALKLGATVPAPPFLLVDGKVKVGGNLSLSFKNVPEEGVTETWFAIRSNGGNIEGRFNEPVLVNVTDMGTLMSLAEHCFDIAVTLQYRGSVLNITTRRHNICLENARRHPGVVAAIVLGVLSVVFSAVALLVLWRKRRFDRSRAAMLSSPLSDESELQELRESSGTAKMIESTSGRFEIGDDEIDDPEL